MLYYLFDYIENHYNLPGAGVFQFVTFRAAAAIILSLLISLVLGNRIIRYLKRLQIGESIRDLGLAGQQEKEGTPTMGGVIILLAILLPCLLFARLDNIYIILMLVVTVWMGVIGFTDDYIKVFKKDKQGLHGKFKILGQVILGLIVGVTMLYTNRLDYAKVAGVLGGDGSKYVGFIFIPLVILIVTAVSNAANLTDGIDGLATGVSAIIAGTLAILAYVSAESSELVIFSACLVGSCIGFLWYNSFPAQVFMGDTGSLALGGIIAALAILLRKELLIPLLCGIFVVENLSVMLQVSYFKYTKKKYGEGRRIFKMSPIHHHFQKSGIHESKIVTRFWIVGVMLAVLTIITLKLR
ncbi:UNVERIFIED_CONTAM: hypothetical protein GTU68_014787 [Idotea baltica]|nr:hypothetical protein [Idotea baltica]